MDILTKYKSRRKYYVYREKVKRLVNKSTFVFKKKCHVLFYDNDVKQIESPRETMDEDEKEEGRKEKKRKEWKNMFYCHK